MERPPLGPLLPLLLACALLAAGTSAETDSRSAERARRAAAFAAIDANGDGLMASEEMPGQGARWMLTADANGDGGLDLDEYAAFLDQPGARFDLPIPPGVVHHPDVPYAGTSHHRQQLDVYVPREPAGGGPLPVIAHVHGGGWSMGSRLMARPHVLPHVASGHYAAVAIGYRLTGEAAHPAQIHDVKAGLRWIRANAERYGFDPDRICVMGASAGGHLAALVGTTNGSAAHAGSLGPSPELASDVACAIPVFGPMDLTKRLENLSPSVAALLAGPEEERTARAREASPLLHVDPQDPPHYLIHGTADPLVPYADSVTIDAAFRGAGVATALLTIEGGGHGDFFDERVTTRVRAFLDWALRGEGTAPPSETLEHPAPTR